MNSFTHAMEKAKEMLHTSCVPDKMLCREEECKQLMQFIRSCIAPGGEPKTLYISGVPGTGKTASVKSVVNELQFVRGKNDQKVKKFSFVEVNGLEVADPKKVYTEIFKQLYPYHRTSRIPTSRALAELNSLFLWTPDCGERKQKTKNIIILVDEVDTLLTRRQDVLYTLFNWSNNRHSRCSIIAISNTLDFPERLTLKVSSRLGMHRIVFQAYNHEQIQKIIEHRLKSTDVIDPGAIQLTSRKVAALSGDLRKAFDLMRRAIDIALEGDDENLSISSNKKHQLRVEHVTAAIKESTSSVRMEFCLAMVGHEEAMFRALVKDLKAQGLDNTVFFRLLDRYRSECIEHQELEPLCCDAAYSILMDMAESHIVVLSSAPGLMARQIRLGFPLSEADFCIRQMDKEKEEEKQKVTYAKAGLEKSEGEADC